MQFTTVAAEAPLANANETNEATTSPPTLRETIMLFSFCSRQTFSRRTLELGSAITEFAFAGAFSALRKHELTLS
jgi:hypothetical protein